MTQHSRESDRSRLPSRREHSQERRKDQYSRDDEKMRQPPRRDADRNGRGQHSRRDQNETDMVDLKESPKARSRDPSRERSPTNSRSSRQSVNIKDYPSKYGREFIACRFPGPWTLPDRIDFEEKYEKHNVPALLSRKDILAFLDIFLAFFGIDQIPPPWFSSIMGREEVTTHFLGNICLYLF